MYLTRMWYTTKPAFKSLPGLHKENTCAESCWERGGCEVQAGAWGSDPLMGWLLNTNEDKLTAVFHESFPHKPRSRAETLQIVLMVSDKATRKRCHFIFLKLSKLLNALLEDAQSSCLILIFFQVRDYFFFPNSRGVFSSLAGDSYESRRDFIAF